MKKLFTFMFLLLICSIQRNVSAQESCNASLYVHYHRFDEMYADYELSVANHQTIEEKLNYHDLDDFGAIYEVPICSIAKDKITINLSEKDTLIKDGIDFDNDGEVENKWVDITDIRDTNNSKHVYVMQGAKDVFEQETDNFTYLGRPNHGHVIIIYYDPLSLDDWKDFNVANAGEGISGNIDFDYYLGVQGGTNPRQYRMGIINIASDAEDLIGITIRKNKAWDEKDTAWVTSIVQDEQDDFGNRYQSDGQRYINVEDFKGGGYKFIYMVRGNKTIYNDYEIFLAETFAITEAEFTSLNELSLIFNQNINYDPNTGPDASKFVIVDEDNNELKIDEIKFDRDKTSASRFKVILGNNIENKAYKLKYTRDDMGEGDIIEKDIGIAEGLFNNLPVEDIDHNYTPYIIAGSILLIIIIVGVILYYRKKRP